jgi:hypothetical protein
MSSSNQCRARKAKCTASPPDTCSRCAAAGRPCEWTADLRRMEHRTGKAKQIYDDRSQAMEEEVPEQSGSNWRVVPYTMDAAPVVDDNQIFEFEVNDGVWTLKERSVGNIAALFNTLGHANPSIHVPSIQENTEPFWAISPDQEGIPAPIKEKKKGNQMRIKWLRPHGMTALAPGGSRNGSVLIIQAFIPSTSPSTSSPRQKHQAFAYTKTQRLPPRLLRYLFITCYTYFIATIPHCSPSWISRA